MPFKSKAQNAWAHTPAGTKALGGAAKVKEWEGSTDYSHLPQKLAKGGVVKSVDQDVGDHIPKGEPFHHQRMAGGGGKGGHTHKGGIGGHNDGHGIYAEGGPVRNTGNDKHYKTETRNSSGHFLSTEDRFTGGRKPAGFPDEGITEEDWTKSKGVGLTEPDDAGDCKKLKPVVPHGSAGHYSYAKE